MKVDILLWFLCHDKIAAVASRKISLLCCIHGNSVSIKIESYCTKCSIFSFSNYQHPSFFLLAGDTPYSFIIYYMHKCKNAKMFDVLNKTLTLRTTWFESTTQASFCLGWTQRLIFITPVLHHLQCSFSSHGKTFSFARSWHKVLFRFKTARDEWLLHLKAFVGGSRMSTQWHWHTKQNIMGGGCL